MDQPPLLEPQAAAPAPPQTSVAAKLLNIFATPGDVFEEIKHRQAAVQNWLVPTLILACVGAVAIFVMFSQPSVQQKIFEQQQQRLDKQVEAGKLTREQADKQLDGIQKFGPIAMKIGGAVSAVIGAFLALFWSALILWLIGRFALRAQVGYLKMAEVVGLSSAIGVLEIAVKLLLVVSLSNPLASPSFAMLLKEPDPQSHMYMVLNALDVMIFWMLTVRAIGLAKLANVSFVRAAAWVFVLWLVLTSAFMGLGIALQGLVK